MSIAATSGGRRDPNPNSNPNSNPNPNEILTLTPTLTLTVTPTPTPTPPPTPTLARWASWVGELSLELIVPVGCDRPLKPYQRLVVEGVVPVLL